jgi:Sec-independent protein translocase protein TatA
VLPVLNLDPAKLLIIAVVAVILLGPDKRPQVARQVGAAWRSLSEFRHRIETEVRASIPDLPSSHDVSRMVRSPTALLNHLSTLGPDDKSAPSASVNSASVTSDDGTSPDGASTNRTSGDDEHPQHGLDHATKSAHNDDSIAPTLAGPAVAMSEAAWPVEVVAHDPNLN